MSRRVFSRPRTKVYDANYNMGESYYKSALDGIDKKYGRLGSSEPAGAMAALRASLDRESSRPTEVPSPRAMTREAEADEFFDDFAKRKTQAASMLGEFDSLFESRVKNGLANEKGPARAMKAFEDEIEEDLASSMKRLKAVKAAREAADEIEDLEASSKRSLRSKMDFSDKLMDSVGLSGKARAALEEEAVTGKRRVLKITATSTTATESSEGDNLTRWTALKSGPGRRSTLEEEAGESAAAARARKSRAMLDDIEAEMQAIAERGAAREKRVRDLKALVGENEASSLENLHSTMRIKNSIQSEKKMVSY